MRRTFVKIDNVNRFLAAFTALENRGAQECCLMVIDGLPGLAKTSVTEWWAAENDAVFVRAKSGWTGNWMLSDLLTALNVVPRHSFEAKFEQLLVALGQRQQEAMLAGRSFAVVIDEIDHICRREKMLEPLRDLTDHLQTVPMIWVGMGKVRTNLTLFPQIASRVAQYVQFTPASMADTRALVEGLCEVPVADDLIEYLHRVSKGRIREIKEGIMAIERVGKLARGKTVDRAMMVGKVLLNSRDTGEPIKVEA